MVTAIFIGGTAKSGSTITDRLLATQPGVLGLGEVDHMLDDTKLHHPRAAVYGPVRELDCSCGLQLQECPVWGPVMSPILVDATGTFDERYNFLVTTCLASMEEHQDPIIVDSSKEPAVLEKLVRYAAQPDTLITDVRVVIIARNPRDWLVSDDLRERSRGRKRNLRIRLRRLRKWEARYRDLLALCNHHGLTSVVVDLADIQEDPGPTIHALFEALGLKDRRLGPVDLQNSTTHIVWGSHHRLKTPSQDSVWRSKSERKWIVWLLPWLLSPQTRRYSRELLSRAVRVSPALHHSGKASS